MRIRISTIVKFCTIVVLLFMAGYSAFNLVSISGLTNYDFRITTIIGFIIACLFLRKVENGWYSMSLGFRRYILATLASIAILALYTVITYSQQTIQLTFREVCQYLIVIWAVPIYYWLKSDESEDGFLEIINLISVVWCVLILLQSIYYASTGGVLFPFLENASSGLREGNLRISTGAFTNFSIMYCFWKFYCKKDKRRLYHIICFAVMFAATIIVTQGRANTAILVIALAAIILSDSNRGYRVLRKLLFIAVMVIIAVSTNFLQDYLTEVFGRYEISVSARTYAYGYYWSVFLDNPIFGFGLLKDQTHYSSIYSGPLGLAFADDVGFVGQLAILGIFALIIIIALYIHLFRQIQTVKRQTGTYNAYMIGIFVYLIASSVTLIIFDQQRIALLPIIIGLFEYYSFNSQKEVSYSEG